ncbi:MAG: kinase [Pseudoxanthomonas sp.]
MVDSTHAPTSGFTATLVASALDAALASGHATPVFGIVGLQGSGKSTLAAQMGALARTRGLQAAIVSLDDFYLGRKQRQQLAREVHPLLATRGPPGTHDLVLALETMARLRDGAAVALPRFDKLADDLLPRTQWPRVQGRCQLVILEGWFLKTPAQDPARLRAPVNALERSEDAEGQWRSYCNTALGTAYPALWETIDALWLLQGPGFEVVQDWRWQQEQALQEQALQEQGRTRKGMSRAQVERFVQFFERVSRQALQTLPAIADVTVRLDRQRNAAAKET